MFYQPLYTFFTPVLFAITLRRFSLAFLLVMGLSISASAQDTASVLAARLVSEPSIRAGRPRAVLSAEKSPAVVVTPMPTLEEATLIERQAFEKTNDERVKAGLIPLAWDAELCLFARVHSENMARLNFFGHETPDGMRLKERARAQGILHFRVIAENIAYNKGYADPGVFAVERWMISAGHRANILYVGFQSAAIGSFIAKDGSVYVTQVFINR